MTIRIYKKWHGAAFGITNNTGADQIVRMRRLVCAYVCGQQFDGVYTCIQANLTGMGDVSVYLIGHTHFKKHLVPLTQYIIGVINTLCGIFNHFMSGWLVFTLICSTNCADRDGENNSNLISYVR